MGRSALLLLSIVALLIAHLPAHATSVTVPDDIPTLQAVMDSLNSTGRFDTVYVKPGVVTDSLYAVNLEDLTVMGLGDSLTRPSIGRMTVNSNHISAFVNLRFTGLIHTIGEAFLAFHGCRLESGFTSGIDGSPRSVSFVGCRITGTVFAYSDVGLDINACWLDQGSVVLREDGVLNVGNSTFTGPSDGTAITATGDVHVSIRGNTIRGFASAISAGGEETIVIVERNVIEDCGTGIGVSGIVQVSENTVTDCAGHGIAVGISGPDARIERNIVGRCGGHGLYLECPSMSFIRDIAVVNNTSFGNAGSGFAFLLAEVPDQNDVTHNIGYGNGGHGLLSIGPVDPGLSCNDWFGNDSSAVSGVDPSPTDLALDPLFCDVANDSVSLAANSPLLNAPGCGLIGARGMGCASTATLVTMFTAHRVEEGVRVSWQLADPTRLAEIWIERSDHVAGPWAMIVTERFAEGEASVAIDRSVVADQEYWYRLVAREGGQAVVIGEGRSVVAGAAGRFELIGVTPNPSFGPLRITFTLPRDGEIEIDVLDLQGRHVAEVIHGSLAAGEHGVEWKGQSLSPGLYFLKYLYPGGSHVSRVVRLR